MDLLTILLTLLISYALIKTLLPFSGVGKPKNLPPGPTPLPIIGNLHLLGNQPHQSLATLAKTHGPIMFLRLGRVPTLVISSAAAAREVLQKQDLAFCNRHVPDALHAHNHFLYSVAWMPMGTQWRTLRKIVNSNIFSGRCLDADQNVRSEKVRELVRYLRKAAAARESVDIGRAAFRTSLNLLSNTIFSKDLTDPYEDSGKEFKETVANIMVEVGKPNLVDFFPWLEKIDLQGIRRRLTENFGKVFEIFEGLIKERLETCGPRENGDVLDVCLNVSRQELSREHIKSLFLDLFVAGTDTTSSTLEWAMTEVLRNPHTMMKAKEELSQVIGKGKILEEGDASKLAYLQCIVKETLRIHTPIPLLLPRTIETDIEINGYTIPKATQVFVNAWAIGRDPMLWEDPTKFKPERFLNSKLDVKGKDFELIPFGGGRRICPGLPLVMRVVPVMLGSLLNNFNWKLDGGTLSKEMDMTEDFGITLRKAVPLCVVPTPLS